MELFYSLCPIWNIFSDIPIDQNIGLQWEINILKSVVKTGKGNEADSPQVPC